MSESEPGPYSLLLPQVIPHSPRRSAEPRPLRILDARRHLEEPFAHNGPGWLFEARVRHPENLAAPNQLTLANLTNASLLARSPLDWDECDWLATEVGPLLAAIPATADLFQHWPAVAEPTLALLELLTGRNGLDAATATCLVYQKRPALVPILDRVTRAILYLPGRKAGRRELFRATFSRFLEAGRLPENWVALDRLSAWAAGRPEVTRYLSFSRVRLLNLVAATALTELYEPKAIRRHRKRRLVAAGEGAPRRAGEGDELDGDDDPDEEGGAGE